MQYLCLFGMLLNFRMVCYPHNLAYNVVEAFDDVVYSLEIEAGNIKIFDKIVHSAMSLPIKNDLFDYNAERDAYSLWADE